MQNIVMSMNLRLQNQSGIDNLDVFEANELTTEEILINL